MAVSGCVAVPVAVPMAVPVAGLTKRFFNQKDFLINVWGYPSIEQQHCALEEKDAREEPIPVSTRRRSDPTLHLKRDL